MIEVAGNRLRTVLVKGKPRVHRLFQMPIPTSIGIPVLRYRVTMGETKVDSQGTFNVTILARTMDVPR